MLWVLWSLRGVSLNLADSVNSFVCSGMSDLPFNVIREVLEGQRVPDPQHLQNSDSCHDRLLKSLQASSSALPADVAALLRHVLRQEEERQGSHQWLRVPKGASWPGPEEWRAHGIQYRDEESTYLIRAKRWTPEWLPYAEEHPPAREAFGRVKRRSFTPVPGDPFLTEAPFEGTSYRCEGQREAVRNALLAPPGATFVVTLPTGAGKSLVAHIHALLQRTGVTVVVVPTTALALDQERALRHKISHPLAYYGGSDEETRERNVRTRERIRNGTQRIIFTSPEGLLGSLVSAIYAAAREGHLHTLVVDEAHIVDQWGDSFRASFQDLAGLRMDLLREAKEEFRTLLLTATLNETTLRTLHDFFGRPGPFGVLSAVQLRPEPSYWFAKCSEAQQQERVLESIRHLPRPLILYTSRVQDAKDWYGKLCRVGYARISHMTGETSAAARDDILRQWRQREIDVMVATSAFGLGVDQSDVRAVVHACVPESIDRYYQEVGRGGRDGYASVSMVLYTEEDLAVDAKNLSRRVIIGNEKGIERWGRMHAGREPIDGDRWRVPIDVGRTLDQRGSDTNRAWNVRTLTLMHRAGLISLDGEPPPTLGDLPEDTEPEQLLTLLQDYSGHRVVRIREGGHLRRETWEKRVEPERRRIEEQTKWGLEAMKRLLRGEDCVAEYFRDTYSVQSGEDEGMPAVSINVATACGGCHACRREGHARDPVPPGRPRPVWETDDPPLHSSLKQLLREENKLTVFISPSDRERRWRRTLAKVIRWAIDRGVRAVVADPDTLEMLREQNIGVRPFAFFYHEYKPFFMPDVPHIIFDAKGDFVRDGVISYNGASPHILLAPSGLSDPRAPYRALDVSMPGLTMRWRTFMNYTT